MTSYFRGVVSRFSLFLIFAVVSSASAQQAASTKYLTGQSVQPVFEGWEQNPDGSYSLWFGYLNRNWAQRLEIPIGPQNIILPGEDFGQPTIFQTGEKRRQYFAFKVVVPADWPKDRDVVWTLTANGTTLKAFGSLWPVWLINGDVISANRGALRDTDPTTTNNPPIVIEAPKDATVAVGAPLTLTVAVTDDDMPKRRRPGELVAGSGVVAGGGAPRATGREGAGREGEKRADAQVGPPIRDSLRVSWVQWRGPGLAKFDPDVARVLDATGKQTGTVGRATTTVTFDKPGQYLLRGYAEDMSLFAIVPDVRVTVMDASPSEPLPR